MKAMLVLTQTANSNQVPFCLLSTLGGTDLDSRVTLRGWDNYRFRGQTLRWSSLNMAFPSTI